MYRHIIWDFDGTLFDTYPVMSRAYSESMEQCGFPAPYDEVYGLMKRSMSALNRFYAEKYGNIDAAREVYRARRCEFPPYAGIPELLADIVARGGRNYVLTHRDATLFDSLDGSGLTSLFADFVTDEMGFPRKPAPDGLIALMNKNGIPKDDALMIGDRELDVLTGVNAGIDSCAFWDGTGEKPASAKFFADSVDAIRKVIFG